MDLNKAIRKQTKSYKRFLLSMGFIFLILPLILFVSRQYNYFFISYLCIIEILILSALINRVNYENLKYEYNNYKIIIKRGMLLETIQILCEKVVLVHTTKKGNELEILLLTTSRFRNRKVKLVDVEFLKYYSYPSYFYQKAKRLHPETQYYYILIKEGKMKKYALLNLLYRGCVQAHFTEDAIERIKEYRK